MGRKKTKKQTLKSPDEDSVDILVQILEDAGIFQKNGAEEGSWETCSKSIETLAIKLEKYRSNNRNSDAIGESAVMMVLDIEEATRMVRQDAKTLEIEIEALDSGLQLCRDLELSSRQLCTLAKSLNGAISRQKWTAQDTLYDLIQTLDNLYSKTEDQSSTKSTLTNSASLFRKRCIEARHSPWREALSVLQDDYESNVIAPEVLEEVIAFGFEPKHNKLQLDDKQLSSVITHTTIFDAVQAFASGTGISHASFTSVLLLGPEGSGKTQCCDEIERMVKSMINVIRPTLPYDIMGKTIGATEDILVSILLGSPEPSIIILDDIDKILGSNYFSSATPTGGPSGDATSGQQVEPHVTTRLRSLFLSLLDRLKMASGSSNQTLLICTSVVDLGKSVGRFDKTYHLSIPDEQVRQAIIFRCIGTLKGLRSANSALHTVRDTERLFDNIVECTAGLSYAELAQNCRQAMLASCKQYESSQQTTSPEVLFLVTLREQVQMSTPNSLRSGFNADSLDMRVMSGKDLLEMSKNGQHQSNSFPFPLFGKSAGEAWENIRRTVVVPICQAMALKNLIYHTGGQGGRIFSGGVLLTGKPGCGKSALAYHAAMVASNLNPAVKLVDVSCTSLISKEVGSSERSVHRLFEAARAAAPCILLMDGIENVAAVRGNDNTTEGTMDRVLSTLLVELDGVNGEKSSEDNGAGFAVIGITHNSKWIDPALLRPGRLGHIIELGYPEYEARKEIVLREFKGAECVDDSSEYGFKDVKSLSDFIASKTEGFSGAIIIAVCNEAKMLSSRALTKESTHMELRPQHILSAIEARTGAIP
ncbi:unnamed protein product [Cylindrotheca closterium]|uniref:AAA+ ATPase domain-containing protein n=1 Tax=Cylindrotheca closterium TaxID=2856 RepID=A0AAD2JPG5_9STRA|nr:unnamed protein product [Cylindrotheca closterium]